MKTTNVTTVEDINRNIFIVMRPAFILVSILMPIGVLGNGAVLYIYGFRFKKLPVNTFLVCLGVFDMIGCLFGMPLEIFGMLNTVIYTSGILCKLEKFLVYYSISTSTLTLLIISVERYNKICRHYKQQLTVKEAKVISCSIGLICIVVALPGGLFFNKRIFPITQQIEYHMCVYEVGYEKVFTLFYLISLVIDIIILVIIFVLYYRICKVVKEHVDNITNLNSNNTMSKQQNLHSHKKIRQTNKILVCITVLFTISLTPGLILGIFSPKRYEKDLPVFVECLRQICFRMWIINGAINPIVYGLLNARFRHIIFNCIQNKSEVKGHSQERRS